MTYQLGMARPSLSALDIFFASCWKPGYRTWRFIALPSRTTTYRLARAEPPLSATETSAAPSGRFAPVSAAGRP